MGAGRAINLAVTEWFIRGRPSQLPKKLRRSTLQHVQAR